MSRKYINDILLEKSQHQLFPDSKFEKDFKSGECQDSYFIKRDYKIRLARTEDLPAFIHIEKQCWASDLQTEYTELQQRLSDPACLNFVLVYEGRTIGVIYTQRIRKGDIKKIRPHLLEKYRTLHGDYIQFIALNIQPVYQDRGYGFELLEFVLQYVSLHPEIQGIYAVTRCRDFPASKYATLQEYLNKIYKDGKFDDPILNFHQLHGAKVLGLIDQYRPLDTENQGYGVLIKYDIKTRPWRGRSIAKSIDNKKKHTGNLFLDFLYKRRNTDQLDMQKSLKELGFDSLDFADLIVFINEKMGVDISMRELSSRSLQELHALCEGRNKEKAISIEAEPLKKRIRGRMREYPEIVPLSLEGRGPCTFWIHPLSGDVGIYNGLANQADGSFRMIAIKAKGFLSAEDKPLKSVIDMAAYYCEIITAVEPEGPYHLAGFSFGGSIAYEMAYQLQMQGKEVATLALVEAPFISGKESHLFQTTVRNNLLMNANFLLMTLLNMKQSPSKSDGKPKDEWRDFKITADEVKDIRDEDLISSLCLLCKQKGLRQPIEDLEFKLRSMSEVHWCNLSAIHDYQAKKIPYPNHMRCILFRTKSAQAVSDTIWNPDYLENIQREKGSLLPLMKEWNKVFPQLQTILLDGENHFDALHSRESIEKFYCDCKTFYLDKLTLNKSEEIYPSIAVVGMAGRFPDAENIREFWENLKSGHNSIREVPDDRGYHIEDYYDETPKLDGKTYAKWGGFLSDIDKFDPLFFKISPRDAQLMDPSERLFIQEAWKAIEDAGYNPRDLNGKQWGVFACAKGDYPLAIHKEDENYYLPTDSYSAARISYLLNFKGPAMTIDTACSSTSTVIAEACNSLVLGECEAAIAGGGAVYATPHILTGSSQSLLLSPDGQCYSFDQRANGTVVAEAVGAIVLKKLDKAVADKDHIYGVIRGWGINQDGKTNGITAPSGRAQSSLQTGVYERFHINPEDITMVEAHGTGTSLGDAIEYQALVDSFQKFTAKSGYCALGSVKTNIGHAFFGSGIAGIIKVMLSIKNGKIPPSLNYENPSAKLDIKDSPFYINTQLREWKTENKKLRCAVMNSFGATGTNVHLVIEEYLTTEKESAFHMDRPVIIVLSAKEEVVLQEYVVQFLKALAQKIYTNSDLERIAYTLQFGRESMKERLALAVSSIGELIEQLKNYLAGAEEAGRIYRNKAQTGKYIDAADNEYERRKAMEDWLKHKEADQLLELWTQGADINWEYLYQNEKPVRISLPTYPFSKERYWIPQKKSASAAIIRTHHTKQPAEVQEESYELLEFTEEWKEALLPEETAAKLKTVVCFLSDTKSQKVIKDFLRKDNPEVTVIYISQEKDFKKADPDHYFIVKDKKQTYEKAFRSILADVGEISAMTYLWAYEDAKCMREYRNIVYILQAIASEKVIVERLLLGAPYTSELEKCYLDSWIGFERSIGTMMSKTRVKVILQDRKTLEYICKELKASYHLQSVLYEGEKRYEKVILEKNIQDGQAVKGSFLKAGGTYFITGGLGKLGLIFARYLAKEYRANLILSGRSELKGQNQKTVIEIERFGGQVFYIQSDICDKNGMKRGIDAAIKQFGQIHGIIHAAGMAAHQSIFQKDMESFETILGPKIRGTLLLEELFDGIPLDFICYFSSAAAIMGDFGACDYAVGNRFLMAYASCRNKCNESGKRAGKSVVINWPLWKDGGMGLGAKDNEMYLKSSGQRSLETEEGLALFEKILTQPQTQHLVLAGQRSKVYQFLHIQKEKELESVTRINKEERQEFDLAAYLECDLKNLISELHHIPVEKLEVREEFVTYGFDSINIFEFARMISNTLGIDITPSSLLSYSTLEKLIEYLVSAQRKPLLKYYGDATEGKVEVKNTQEKSEVKQLQITYESGDMTEPIAVIGISGRFPQADTVEEFWKNLNEQKECITEVPTERWDWDTIAGDSQRESKKSNSRWGGFLRNIDSFDPMFFKISPREAHLMDPCQRIFLEESWHALEDAGYMGDRIKGKSCGVYVGIEEGEYGYMVRQKGEFYSNQNAMLSARIAYALDLKGPNLSITASCSSGLAALHQACQALRCRDCELALAGGINLFVSPTTYVGMSMLNLLSPTGKTYVFDERADGLVPGEAVTAVLLKPLSKAIHDKDHIYGCIKGSGVNNNGKGHGIMAPNPLRQEELIQNTMDKYKINPADIQLVISHSVGTKLGDAAEVESLRNTFEKYTDQKQYCSIGSVKPIVGHTFAASGIVSFIAMLLAMKNKTKLGVHNFENSNESIDFENTPFVISKNNQPWTSREERPRIGAISTSGISGTNAFAVIEEYTEEEKVGPQTSLIQERQLYVFSAADEVQLKKVIERMLEYIQINNEISVVDIAYTLQIGREPMASRLAIVAKSREELLSAMRNYLNPSGDMGERVQSGKYFTGQVSGISSGMSGVAHRQYNKLVLEELIKSCNLEMIAVHWTNGGEMIWEYLHERMEKGRIIPLPLYPFKREPYWISFISSEKNPEKRGLDEKIEMPLKEVVKNYILDFFSEKLGMQKEQLDMNKSIQDYGVESILMMRFIRDFEQQFQYRVSARDIINYPTIQLFATYLTDKLEEDQIVLPKETYQNEAVIEAMEKYLKGDISLEHAEKMIGETI